MGVRELVGMTGQEKLEEDKTELMDTPKLFKEQKYYVRSRAESQH